MCGSSEQSSVEVLFQWLTALKVPHTFPLYNRLPFRDLSLGSLPIEETAISPAHTCVLTYTCVYIRLRVIAEDGIPESANIGTPYIIPIHIPDPKITNVVRNRNVYNSL